MSDRGLLKDGRFTVGTLWMIAQGLNRRPSSLLP
jgi:hypothetical protein